MTKEQLEKEAEDKAIELEESQTIGIYDNDEDYEYDRGWNKGEVAGFREGYLAGAEPREKRIQHLEESLLDVTEKSVRQIAELEEELARYKLKVAALEGETPWKDIKDKSEVLGKLSKARELLKTFLLIADNKVSQMEFQLCVADAKQFLKESDVE